jgi:hypothetical protein
MMNPPERFRGKYTSPIPDARMQDNLAVERIVFQTDACQKRSCSRQTGLSEPMPLLPKFRLMRWSAA